jgi:hypothetical protein
MLHPWQSSPRTHLPHDRVLHPAAPVVVVHMDELPLRKQLAAHPAGISLDFQEQIEVILRQSVAGYPVLTVGFPAGLR